MNLIVHKPLPGGLVICLSPSEGTTKPMSKEGCHRTTPVLRTKYRSIEYCKYQRDDLYMVILACNYCRFSITNQILSNFRSIIFIMSLFFTVLLFLLSRRGFFRSYLLDTFHQRKAEAPPKRAKKLRPKKTLSLQKKQPN